MYFFYTLPPFLLGVIDLFIIYINYITESKKRHLHEVPYLKELFWKDYCSVNPTTTYICFLSGFNITCPFTGILNESINLMVLKVPSPRVHVIFY